MYKADRSARCHVEWIRSNIVDKVDSGRVRYSPSPAGLSRNAERIPSTLLDLTYKRASGIGLLDMAIRVTVSVEP